MKKVLLIFVSALAITAAATILFKSNLKQFGHMNMCVYDAMTSLPIEGAYIVLPQSGQSFVSDCSGRIQAYGVPLDIDSPLNSVLRQSYGSTTVIAYKDGYLPCCIFFVQLYPEQVRDGPNIYMFSQSNEHNLSVTSFIESPPEEWVIRLIEKYTPFTK